MTHIRQAGRGILCLAVLLLWTACSEPVSIELDGSSADTSKSDVTVNDKTSNEKKSDPAKPNVTFVTPVPTKPREVPLSFADLTAQVDRLDRTVWSKERIAQQYEQTLVRLWDDLLEADRRGGDKFAVLAEVPFQEVITVGTPQPATSYDLGIRSIPLAGPGRKMNRAEWTAYVDGFRRQGYRIVQSEWHHARFTPHQDGSASSTVSMALHVLHEKQRLRCVVQGELEIEWTAEKDKHGRPLPRTIDATKLRLLVRTGPPAFTKLFSFDPSTSRKPGNIHPVMLHDLDGDGLSEIMLGGCNRLYRNRGGGKFDVEPLFSHPVPVTPVALVADINGDGIVDYLTVDQRGDLIHYRGDKNGRFSTPPVGRSRDGGPIEHPQVLAAGDIDGDGDLDLWVAQYLPSYNGGQMPTPYYDANDGLPSFLLINDGKGQFREATEQAGLAKRRNRRTFAASLIDLDNDTDLDLLVVSDFAGVDMYYNDGNGKFTDANSKILGDRHLFGMATAFGDFNLDGRLDFFVAGMGSTTARRLDRLGLGRGDMAEVHQMRARMGYGNRMYLATDAGYVEPAFKDQVARTGWTWGMTSVDFDNDGDRDIFVANGHSSGKSTKDHCTHFWCHDIYTNSSKPNPARAKLFGEMLKGYLDRSESWDGYQKNALLMNLGGKGFVNVGFLMGVADQFDSRAVVGDDLDGDGRMDLLVVEDRWKQGQTLHVYRNQLQTPNHWIGVRLRQEGPKRSPLGAKITVRTPDRTHVGRIVTGETISAQHASTIHFGLGKAKQVDSIEVRWVDGTVRRIKRPAVNEYHTVEAE